METVRNVLYFLFVLLEVILIFNLLIVVHELGHFLAARWRGLVVEQFAVWFGKPLWKRTYNGVVYSLGSIPFGGFVKLPQMAPMDAIEGESDVDKASLPVVSPLDKIIVALAGPVFSFGLAFLFAMLVWGVGRPRSEAESTRTIGFVVPDSPASEALCKTPGVPAGLRSGDEILSIDGHDVKRFGGMTGSVVWYVARSENDSIAFEVKRGGSVLTFYPKPQIQKRESFWQRTGLREVMISPAFESIVKTVAPDSPAARAGIHENDVVTAANGEKLWSPLALLDLEQNSFGRPIPLVIERNGQAMNVTLPALSCRIAEVMHGGPAESAGMKKGDVITAINGAPLTRFSDMTAAVTQAPEGKAVHLTLLRDGREQSIDVVPKKPVQVEAGENRPFIGIERDEKADGIGWMDGGRTKPDHLTPVEQISDSVTGIVNTVGAVIAPKSKIGLQHLGGPLMIGQTYFYLLSGDDGWRLALWFSVVLNVNLALLNLLPIPVLDGGHILLAIIEAIRRKPVNLRVLEIVQTACFVLIVSYMLYVTRFDVGQLFSGQGHHEMKFPSSTPAAQGK